MDYKKIWENYQKALPSNNEGGKTIDLVDYTKYVADIVSNGIAVENYSNIIEAFKITKLERGMKATTLRDKGIVFISDIPLLIKKILKNEIK